MRIGLFIPCYIDQLYPGVGIATYELLKKLGCDVDYPENQTCCGQPMANSGFAHLTRGCDKNFISNFKDYDYIVGPSGSCVLHVKDHLNSTTEVQACQKIKHNIYELTEFLTDILEVKALKSKFPHKVGLHNSCHGQRGLGLSSMTERNLPAFSKVEMLLNQVEGLKIERPKRNDECCGFGGTFCVFEEAVSVKMGKDRIAEHEQNDVEYITGGDVSCLMHLEGILKRQGSKVKTIHIAEILNHD
ncbi:(Fe-S)-binding protein [Pseudopedobacter beijingensis]|uniref:(Fe-S)-binding protein n=1 Tax=Pseudopedobacter beijingensis TaxID=1207056 RepID=A0ABW4IH58_9SPHI